MIKQIDINDWVLSGGGGAGISFFHKTDPSLILKIENRGASAEELEQSLETARIVYSLGIPTPEPGEVVTDGSRFGQIFRRIQGKVSYARLTGENPEMIPALAHEFTMAVKLLHSTIGAGSGLRSIKEIYGDMIKANPFRSQELKDKALRLMDSLPDGQTCIHGDLHFGNLIKAGDKKYFIDISSFGYGHPYFDLAMMVALDRLADQDPGFYSEMYHCTVEQGRRFWHCFISEYFGEGWTAAKVAETLAPYLVVRMFTMESEAGRKLPDPAFQFALDYLSKA